MITRTRAQGSQYAWAHAAVLAAALTFAASASKGQEFSQERYIRGQNIAPAFEGWENNPDGSFNLVFGYFNRNWEEQPDVPIGPNNNIEPGGPDQGQPTHFFPRRNHFLFRIRVPKDFGKSELVWTLTVHGKTERAYATLKPEYILDNNSITRNMTMATPAGTDINKAPVVKVEGDTHRTIKVGEPLNLSALVIDDGIPKPRAAPRGGQEPGYSSAFGLRVSWFVYRGPADKVTFEPEQVKVYRDYKSNSPWTPGWLPPTPPADGMYPVRVTFRTPGEYVLQLKAHDGALSTTQDVTVTVNP